MADATGPGGHTAAEKAAIEKARHDHNMAVNPLGTTARDLARNYPTPHNVNEFSTDDLKAIVRILGDDVFSGATPAFYASGGPTIQQRINNAWCQGGAGIGDDSQNGSPASTFNMDGLGVTGDPSQGTPYVPSQKVIAFVSEFQAYKKSVGDAKTAAQQAEHPDAVGGRPHHNKHKDSVTGQ